MWLKRHFHGMAASQANFEQAVTRLRQFLNQYGRLFVLTGAGLSTGSGVPDYRDRQGSWKGASPIMHQQFVTQPTMRQRYWARSMAGWPVIRQAQPNAGHKALAQLGMAGHIGMLVTQNVDGLHRAAGSHNIVNLHGRLDRVICLDCDTRITRDRMQTDLKTANPAWSENGRQLRPDGDVELGDVDYSTFNVPDCPRCGGVLKPDVVFFGGTVPKPRVERAHQGLNHADAMLVVGSSLMVWSGFRFARAAAEQDKPILILNQGHTRADDLATCKIEENCSAILQTAAAC